MVEIKLFNRWSFKDIEIKDPGIKPYINLDPIVIPKTFGRNTQQKFHKSKMNIVERFANKIMVPGHRGKKHLISSADNVGKTQTVLNIIKNVFEKLEKKTNKNPIEVLVKAIENAALREEIASYQMGGIMVRKAVITSPQRRVDFALKHFVQGAYQKQFNKKKRSPTALADEIINAFNMSNQSAAISKKLELERQADSSR